MPHRMSAVAAAHGAVLAAIEKVDQTAPRDLQGKDMHRKALAEHFARVGKLREVLADLENYGIALLDAGQQQTERWRVETWHRSRVFTGYRVVRGRGDAKELDHCYAADATDTGAINRAFAMAEARRGLLNLRIVEPEGRTITVE